MSGKICQWLNRISPRTDEENMVIQYGIELFLDNVGKILLILLFGCFIGKGKETACILLVFCLLRSQAGGIHAETNFFCMMGMMAVWSISLAVGQVLYINGWIVIGMSVLCIIQILRCVPCTKNLDCYTPQERKRKKLYAIVIVMVYLIFAMKSLYFRTYIITAAGLECLSLRREPANVKKD